MYQQFERWRKLYSSGVHHPDKFTKPIRLKDCLFGSEVIIAPGVLLFRKQTSRGQLEECGSVHYEMRVLMFQELLMLKDKLIGRMNCLLAADINEAIGAASYLRVSTLIRLFEWMDDGWSRYGQKNMDRTKPLEELSVKMLNAEMDYLKRISKRYASTALEEALAGHPIRAIGESDFKTKEDQNKFDHEVRAATDDYNALIAILNDKDISGKTGVQIPISCGSKLNGHNKMSYKKGLCQIRGCGAPKQRPNLEAMEHYQEGMVGCFKTRILTYHLKKDHALIKGITGVQHGRVSEWLEKPTVDIEMYTRDEHAPSP